MILRLIGEHSASGGVGYAIEIAGEAVRNLSVEARLTLCNMGVEFGAWTVIVAPDDKVFEYVRGRPFAPRDRVLTQAIAHWRTLQTDADAVFDREILINCSELEPQVTWGTSPQHETSIDGVVPDPASEPDVNRRQAMERALQYMALQPGTPLQDISIQPAFIGSCTNSRISDLRTPVAFAPAPLLQVNLASRTDSLARSSKRMLRHRHLCSYTHLAVVSFAEEILSPVTHHRLLRLF